ncbi:hypothetical protein BASA81_002754 [Batrachochytrium salamandrivorans]|nr:hypothetical protein BASA81_002754 [Batrachochytrium salamandrivorans]
MFCKVVSTTPSKPSAFASTITREETVISDPNGVWQKDRGGKFNNFLIIDLEVQDASGTPVPLDYFVDLECSLRIVMENGDFGGVLDTVSRTSKRLMSKHLEGQSGKLVVIDADPTTGSGMRIGGSSRTSVKVRINELSKKGSKNSRYSVCFRAVGPGSESFSQLEDVKANASLPLTIYSKVVKTSNYIASAAAAAASSLPLGRGRMAEDEEGLSAFSPVLPSAARLATGGTSSHSASSLISASSLTAAASSATPLTHASSSTPSSLVELELIKAMLEQVLARMTVYVRDQPHGQPSQSFANSEYELQLLALILESCNAVRTKVEHKIKRTGSGSSTGFSPSPGSFTHSLTTAQATFQQQKQQHLLQLDHDLVNKIPLPSSSASSTNSQLQQQQQVAYSSVDSTTGMWITNNPSSWNSNSATASALQALFPSSSPLTTPAVLTSSSMMAEEHNSEKRLRIAPESSLPKFLSNVTPSFASNAFSSNLGVSGSMVGDGLHLQQSPSSLQHHVSSATTSSADFEEFKSILGNGDVAATTEEFETGQSKMLVASGLSIRPVEDDGLADSRQKGKGTSDMFKIKAEDESG